MPSPTFDTIPPSAKPFPEPEEEQQIIGRGPTPTDRLAAQIGKARLFLYKQAVSAEDGVNTAVDKAFNLEQSFTSTIASLAPPRESGEQLMPGLVYVLVASMTGSIMSRNRSILLRASLPLALGIGAGWLVIPVTMGNVADLLWTYEKRFPTIADTHVRTREGIQRAWYMTKLHAELSKTYVTIRSAMLATSSRTGSRKANNQKLAEWLYSYRKKKSCTIRRLNRSIFFLCSLDL